MSKLEDRKLIWIPIAFFFLVLFIYPTLSFALRMIKPKMRIMSNQIGAGFSGGVYGIYLILGWLIKKRTFKKIRWYWLFATAVTSFVAAVLIQLFSYSNGIKYNIWYDSPFLLLIAVSVFELFSRSKTLNNHFILRCLGSYAFGIYLVHFPFKLLLLKPIMRMESSNEFKVVLMWGSLMISGLLSSIIISLIPKAGNYLLYRKSKDYLNFHSISD